VIGKILKRYQKHLGADYHAYVNHAERVHHYACILMLTRESKKLAIAAAFHDLDIWLHGTMDYLKGSSDLARDYLRVNRIDMLADEMAFIIEQHHKLTAIKGSPEAEAFRKADLIDLSAGVIKFNIPSSLIVETEQRFPRLGFTSLVTRKTISWALKHPLKPFPMMKW
jgi:hypothetical protein